MKYLKQITIIFSIALVGELIKVLLPFPIPSSVYGLILMLLLLCFKLVKVEDVKTVSTFLIDIMPIMFVSAAVSIINIWPIFKDKIIPYAIIVLVSTILVMVISGLSTQALLKKEQKND